MIEYLYLISAIVSLIAIVYLLLTLNKFQGGLKTSTYLLAFGILIAVTIHSFFEGLQAFGIIKIETLHIIMPVLILIGSLFLLYGTYVLHGTIKGVAGK